MPRPVILVLIAAMYLAAVGCTRESAPPLVIGGIPDEQVSILEERFGELATYLSGELGITVRYQPSVSYPALVTAFANGDVHLAWFGGLTGVQARLKTVEARVMAQRPRDAQFRSVFVVRGGVAATGLSDLRGLSFTFGSEGSTSGHLMPRYFLSQAGLNPEADFKGNPSYSGSHDKTWKLVESGAFDAGALNEAVWQRAVAQGQVDLSKVRLMTTTDAYFDYHWLAGPKVDMLYGAGTADKIQAALLRMSMGDPKQARVLELFQTDRFIESEPANYDAIEATARSLGLLE